MCVVQKSHESNGWWWWRNEASFSFASPSFMGEASFSSNSFAILYFIFMVIQLDVYMILNYFLPLENSPKRSWYNIDKICNVMNFSRDTGSILRRRVCFIFSFYKEGLCDKVAIIAAGDCQNLDTSIVTKTKVVVYNFPTE